MNATPLTGTLDPDIIRAQLRLGHAADVAEMFATLPPAEAAGLLATLPVKRQAELFGYLPPPAHTAVAVAMRREHLARLVSAMSHDERADLFRDLDDDHREALLPALAQAEREDIRRLAAYAEGTAGSVMTSDYATLPPDLTARAALDRLRVEAPDRETIYDAYVVDARRRLLGVVSLRQIVLANARASMAELMRRDPISVRADAPRKEAANRIARYDLLALPVLDADDRLVGIVTADDAMDVQQQEATEDFHRVGTVSPLAEGVKSAGIFLLYRARIAWLVVLVFGNLFSGLGIAAFEDTIQAHIALVFFLPLLIGSGGNAGSQAATLMVRALATDDVRLSDWSRMLAREAAVAGLLGLSMALAVSLVGIVRAGPEVALVVSLAMVLIVLVGSLVGMSLPFVLARLRLDPATASAPLVTSIADALGVLIYFGIATTLLPLLL
jgi:magnesium transporter